MDAEAAHRQAVRRLRELEHSVDTVDSSHLSIISTQVPSVTSQTDRLQKERANFDVAVWRAKTLAAGCDDPWTQAPMQKATASRDGLDTGEFADTWSAVFGPNYGTERNARKKRAWSKEKMRRDRLKFWHRKRLESNRGSSNSNERDPSARSLTSAGTQGKSSEVMWHFSGRRRGRWPPDAMARYHRLEEERLSLSSDVTEPVGLLPV